MTTGMLLPAGTLVSVNVPSKSVNVETSGLPETSAPQLRHAAPAAKGCRALAPSFGTYTSTLGTGSADKPVHADRPARTVPVMAVFAPPLQDASCLHNPWQPHCPGTPPPPQL